MEEYRVINGWLSAEECEKIKDHILNNLSDHPFPNFKNFKMSTHKNNQYYYDPNNKISDLIKESKDWFEKTFGISDLEHNREHGTIMLEGSLLKSHRDVKDEKNIHEGPGDAYVCLLFISDDYEGGNLVLKDIPLSFKAKAGDVIMFPGWKFEHAVEEVTKGARVNIVIHFFGSRY